MSESWLGPDEAADLAREEVENEIAWAEERDREREEAEDQAAEKRAAAFDAGFEEYLEDAAADG
jgi:transcription elongation GreA/GreB family factor